MIVEISVRGTFFLTNDEPDIRKPVHAKDRARGSSCKGKERELLGRRAVQIGPLDTYLEQFSTANEKQLEYGNRSSIRSLPVIKGAKLEIDKSVRGGSTHYESAKAALDILSCDTVSPSFGETKASKDLAGIVRSLQETPFKITIANFDMLKIGGNYMNKVDQSTVSLDSSGKYWQEKNRAGKGLLNSALVIPPLVEKIGPFPIFEMVSAVNKTLDFVEMLQRAWGYMATAMNDTPIKEPAIAITDMSFPNVYAFNTVFNRVHLDVYLSRCYESLMSKKDFPFPTKVTICENHSIPFLLRSARERISNKILADTCVAGLLLVFQADSMSNALRIWDTLVVVHVSKLECKKSRDNIKLESSKRREIAPDVDDLKEIMSDFDDAPSDENAVYGDRKSLRLKSPFYSLFMRSIEKVVKEDDPRSPITNDLYAPDFMRYAVKQFLSLYPLLSASYLDGQLMNNSYVELHWRYGCFKFECSIEKA